VYTEGITITLQDDTKRDDNSVSITEPIQNHAQAISPGITELIQDHVDNFPRYH